MLARFAYREGIHDETVVDIGGPEGGQEKGDLVGERMAWHVEECPDVWNRLQDAVPCVERQARKRGERVLLVVDVMRMMQQLVQGLNVMQQPVTFDPSNLSKPTD